MIKEWMIANPKLSVVIISFTITLIMTLVTKKFTNQSRMRELKEIQKACQIKLKDAKGDLKKQQEINKEIMACSMELMKHSFKPLFITFIPLILLFAWIRGVYGGSSLGGSWIWWYIGTGVISSIVLRKVLKVV
jgi:uncharacterized membrane protein (DUF106 family)